MFWSPLLAPQILVCFAPAFVIIIHRRYDDPHVRARTSPPRVWCVVAWCAVWSTTMLFVCLLKFVAMPRWLQWCFVFSSFSRTWHWSGDVEAPRCGLSSERSWACHQKEVEYKPIRRKKEKTLAGFFFFFLWHRARPYYAVKRYSPKRF